MILVMNETTVALLLLLGVLVVAAVTTRGIAIVAALLAFASFNFFVLAPRGTFAIANRDDLIALFALLAVGVIGSQLSHVARRRAQEAATLARAHGEAELARMNAEARSALVASFSHDLKTPLTALTVAAGNLGLADLADNDRREQLQVVNAELARLKRLFDNIVDMASVETRAVPTELEWVQAADLVSAAGQQAETALLGRAVEVTDETGDVLVKLEPRLTSAALAHILENAAAYSPSGSPIIVHARIEAGGLVLEVRDHGPGLPPGDVARVFDRFYRGSSAPQNRFGSGMGLAITKGLVTIQGGHVTAANHPEGGAVLTVSIPGAMRDGAELAAAAS